MNFFINKEIDGFPSNNYFLKFEEFIEKKLEDNTAEEIVVDDYYAGINFKERWFLIEGKKWRLVYPDPPFLGYWGEVG